MIDRAARQRRQRHAARGDRLVAVMVRVTHDGVSIRDIEVVTDQDHAEGRMEMVEKDRSRRRFPPGIVSQQRDAIARSGVTA